MLTDNNKKVSLDDLIDNFQQDDELFFPEDLSTNQKEETITSEEEEEVYGQSEKEESVEQPPQEGDNTSDENNETEETPFHKHPRWQKKVEEANELRRKLAEYESRVAPEKEHVHTQDSELPQWWKDIAGDDERSAKAYQELTKNLTEQAAQKLVESQNKQQQEQQQFVAKINSELQAIDDTFGANLLENPDDRTDFLNFVEELSPKDNSGKIIGLPNFNTAYRAWNAERTIEKERVEESKPKPNTIIRKQVSDLTKNANTTAKTEKKVVDVSRMNWSDWRNI